MRQLQRKLDHDSKLQQFLGTKGQKRIMNDLELRNAKRKQRAEERMREQLNLYKNTLEQIQVQN